MMDNFPLFNNSLNLTKDELYSYIEIFPQHNILFCENTNMPNLLFTYHRFHDGLFLKFTWDIISNPSLPHSRKANHVDIITTLISEQKITINDGRIFYFSDANNISSRHAYDLFSPIISKKDRKLTDKEYEMNEFNSSASSIPDIFFDDLIFKLENIINFERYLKNNKKV